MMDVFSATPPDYVGVLRGWEPRTFHDVVAFHARSPAAAGQFFADYGFEVLDRVVDHAVSAAVPAGGPLEVALFSTVRLVAAYARPREVFLMVTEKASISASGSCLVPLLLYGVQCAAIKVLTPPHQNTALFCNLLALALRLVTTAAAAEGVVALAAVDHGVSVASGVLARSDGWAIPAAACSLASPSPSPLDDASGHALVGFLLRLAALGADAYADPLQRRRRVVAIATYIARCGEQQQQQQEEEGALAALAAVVAAPRRVRLFMLRAQWCLLQPEVSRRLRDTPAGAVAVAVPVEGGLDQCIDAEWRATVVGLVDQAAAEEAAGEDARCCEDDLISWEQVTDAAALRLMKELRTGGGGDGDVDDGDDDDEGSAGVRWAGAAATPHERGARSLAGLCAQRAWGVLGLGAAPVAGTEGLACWSVTGAALVTHALLSLCNNDGDGDGDGDGASAEVAAHASTLFPRGVVSPRAQWVALHPHVFALLRCAPAAACEGLGLAASVLGTLLPRAGGARVEYAPPSLLSVTGSASAAGGEHRAPERLGDDDGFAYDSRSPGRVLLAVDAGAGAARARALRLGVAAARSADALLLAQLTVNAMVRRRRRPQIIACIPRPPFPASHLVYHPSSAAAPAGRWCARTRACGGAPSTAPSGAASWRTSPRHGASPFPCPPQASLTYRTPLRARGCACSSSSRATAPSRRWRDCSSTASSFSPSMAPRPSRLRQRVRGPARSITRCARVGRAQPVQACRRSRVRRTHSSGRARRRSSPSSRCAGSSSARSARCRRCPRSSCWTLPTRWARRPTCCSSWRCASEPASLTSTLATPP